MKSLLFIRHAKSSWDNSHISDFDRPLNSRGFNQGPAMAKMVKNRGIVIDEIYSSDAKRAITTAYFFGDEYSISPNKVSRLYNGMPEDYMRVINNLDNQLQTVALFGHNPGITIIANLIETACTQNVPTSSVVIARVRNDLDWAELDWRDLELVDILMPKQ